MKLHIVQRHILSLLVFICLLILAGGSTDSGGKKSSSSSLPKTPSQPAPKISADLSNFTVDRANAQFVFTLQIKNQEPKENTVHVVVYGKNDMFSPPRRNAWPNAGLLFRQAGTRRGSLSSSAISRNWNSRPENTKGTKIVLKANGTDSLEGALPINQTCQHEAWRGKSLNPRSMYNEVYLWVFSKNGKLISEKKYDVK